MQYYAICIAMGLVNNILGLKHKSKESCDWGIWVPTAVVIIM